MIQEAISSLIDGASLEERDASETMREIMTGQATPAQLGAFLTALHIKGETVDEVAGLARVMREHAIRVMLPSALAAVDTCGTGGDRSGTFNISTAAGLLVSALGQPVAKHGNRAATSRCGSADVLEALGVRLELDSAAVTQCVEEVGFGFMFAPAFHPAMRHVGPTRREIGIRTVFNILGPLTNPAGTRRQVLGVAHPNLAPLMGAALQRLGCEHALVVYGEDGLDEISLSAPTQICEVIAGRDELLFYRVTPESLGFPVYERAAMAGGDARYNATILREVLAGRQSGAVADMVAVNAGAALYVAGRAQTLAEGGRIAREALKSGAALHTLEAVVAKTQALAATVA